MKNFYFFQELAGNRPLFLTAISAKFFYLFSIARPNLTPARKSGAQKFA
jgi:hypothetical protein